MRPAVDPQSGSVCAVLDQYVANAAGLMSRFSPVVWRWEKSDTLADAGRRCEANLDGLRIAGEAGLTAAREGIDVEPEAAAVLMYLLAERGGKDSRTFEEAAALLRHESNEVRQAAWRGARLSDPRHFEAGWRELSRSTAADVEAAAAIEILAFQRRAVAADWRAPQGYDEEAAWFLVEAAGRVRDVWYAAQLRQVLARRVPRLRQAALRAAARARLTDLAAVCREAAERGGPFDAEATEFLGVIGVAKDVPRLERAACRTPPATAAVRGLGRLGLPAGVPVLLKLLDHAELAEPAAAAIQRITGKEMPRAGEPVVPAGLSEIELEFVDPKPPVDVGKSHDWWRAESARFRPDSRWQCGLCVSENPLGPIFDQLPLVVRYDVYLRERALTPDTPDWELETWLSKQRCPGMSGE